MTKTTFEENELKSYKGYGISKCFWTDEISGKRKSKAFYLVSEDEEYISDEYETLKEAKAFIDRITKGAKI